MGSLLPLWALAASSVRCCHRQLPRSSCQFPNPESCQTRGSPLTPWAVELDLSWHRLLTGNFSAWWECSPISCGNIDGVTPKCQAGYRGYSVLCGLEATSPLKTQSQILKHIYGPKSFQIRACRPRVSHARYPARGLPWGLLHAHLSFLSSALQGIFKAALDVWA